MKQIISVVILVLLVSLMLTACGCKHETWSDATCDTPKTCAECGATEGAPLGHEWNAANCETAKTCTVCQKTEGEALGHSWADATCEAPKTCQTCKAIEGKALKHDWQDATTEAPKTCKTCNATEGVKITTDPRFTTAACAPLFGKWVCEIPITGEMMGLPDFEAELYYLLIWQFNNDGTMSMHAELADKEAFTQALIDYTANLTYQQLAAQGIDKAAANAVMKQQYGMTVEEYAAVYVGNIDFGAMISAFEKQGVYYLDGNQLYLGDDWTLLEPDEVKIEGNELTMVGSASELGQTEDPVFVKEP
ncbi:MAG: hypothetical protein E7448_01120 [Ruminococcaceae bacterium]|nr:hypothetical protein [Oscillospiraceae bacterium]